MLSFLIGRLLFCTRLESDKVIATYILSVPSREKGIYYIIFVLLFSTAWVQSLFLSSCHLRGQKSLGPSKSLDFVPGLAPFSDLAG
jgi:hypothetical protein